MRSCSIVMAILLVPGGQVLAAPPKGAPVQPEPSQQTAPAVVLASADTVGPQAPVGTQPAPSQPRHRIARVTTCRCGDPQPGDAADDSSDR